MSGPATARPPLAQVWRVGRTPDAWAWTDPQYAYQQRWDDVGGDFRTIYAGDTALACYVEVLAHARPGLHADPGYRTIQEDPDDLRDYPTPAPGSLQQSWITTRVLGTASLTGTYCDITQLATIAALHATLISTAIRVGFTDFDVSALTSPSSSGRELTQTTANRIYRHTSDGVPTYDGIRFTSRHGADLGLWAIFERPDDGPHSSRLSSEHDHPIELDDVDLIAALDLLHLTWQ